MPGYSKFKINTWDIRCEPWAIVVDRMREQDVAIIDCCSFTMIMMFPLRWRWTCQDQCFISTDLGQRLRATHVDRGGISDTMISNRYSVLSDGQVW